MRTKTRTVGTVAVTELKLAHFPPRSALEATPMLPAITVSSVASTPSVTAPCILAVPTTVNVSVTVVVPAMVTVSVVSSPNVRHRSRSVSDSSFMFLAGSAHPQCPRFSTTLLDCRRIGDRSLQGCKTNSELRVAGSAWPLVRHRRDLLQLVHVMS